MELGATTPLETLISDLPLVLDAINTAATHETYVHGEDTDLLILLLNHTKPELKSITLKPHQRKASKKKAKIWPIQEVQAELGVEFCIRLYYVFTGVDTTSRPHGIGKSSAVSNSRKGPCPGAMCRRVFGWHRHP